jgi:hypothetical protein
MVMYALVKVLVTGTMLVTNGLSASQCKREVEHATPLLGVASQRCVALGRDVAFYGTQCSTTSDAKGGGDHVTCVLKAFPKK